MMFKNAEMRIVNGMPLGFKLILSLSDKELISLEMVPKIEERYGFTLTENSMVIAPGTTAATYGQVAQHIKNYLKRNIKFILDDGLKADLTAMADDLSDFANINSLQTGKSKGSENIYESRVSRDINNFNKKFRFSQAIKEYQKGIAHYKWGKELYKAKTCFECFLKLISENDYNLKKPREYKSLINELCKQIGENRDPIKEAESLIENLKKYLPLRHSNN